MVPRLVHPTIYPEQLAYSPRVAKCYRSMRSIGFAVLAWLDFAQASRLRRGAAGEKRSVKTHATCHKTASPPYLDPSSSASSSLVSRLKSSEPSPALRSVAATKRLRGLYRLLPLPCAKSTSQVHARAYRACLRASLRRFENEPPRCVRASSS